MNIFRDRDSVIGERPGQDFLKLKTISLSRMCDWKKIFWTLNNMSRQSFFIFEWGRGLHCGAEFCRKWPQFSSSTLISLIWWCWRGAERFTASWHQQKKFHVKFLVTKPSWTKTNVIMDQNKCYHGPKQKPSWTKTNVFYTERFTASWNQQKRLHVTSKINFLLPKPNSWEENYLLYSNTKEFSNHRELFRGWKDVPSMKLSCFSTFSM